MKTEICLVYVLDASGKPLMPTKRFGKVRRLLDSGKAKVVQTIPFTIQLLYEPDTHYIQPVVLGVDPGREHIGLTATTKKGRFFIGPAFGSIGKVNDVYRLVIYVKLSEYDVLVGLKDMLEGYIKELEAMGKLKTITVQFDFDPMHTV